MISTFKNSMVGALIAALAIASVGFLSPVQAATPVIIEVPVSSLIYAPEGTAQVVASASIDSADSGRTCTVSTISDNQGSVHPGNDLVVASGTSSVILEDVEREAGVTTTANGTLILGNDVTITLVMGSDEIFSAGMTVTHTCEGDPEEIEVCRDGEIIRIFEDVRLETDLDADAAECQPEETTMVCRSGEVVEVKVSEVRESDGTVADCEPEEETIKVCRDDKVVTIKKSEMRSSDTKADDDCGQVESASTGKTLPNTGPGALLGLIGLGGIGAAARSYASSKRHLEDTLLK